MDREGFIYPKIISDKCIDCGKCEAVCPIKYYEKDKTTGRRIYFGVQAKNDRIRFSSTSGGAFSVLAKHILSCKGVVFGAAMDTNGVVYHKDIQRIEELQLLQKSKYVQSRITDCYEKVKCYLRDGRQVLFSGTPCQCQAMKQYIGKNSDKLTIVDFVCYGVPSPWVWQKYLKELEKKYHGKVSDFCFRDKRGRDNGHTVSMKVGNREFFHSLDQDLFCKIYFCNYILRPSCHFCRFCTVERESDITIGDFWGLEKVKPEMEDGMGTSLMILHNEKANKIWKSVKSYFRYFQCEEKDVLQPRLLAPTPQSKKRSAFLALSRILPLAMAEKIVGR